MVQDFKDWLGISSKIVGGENGEKMSRKKRLLALLHNVVEGNYKLWLT